MHPLVRYRVEKIGKYFAENAEQKVAVGAKYVMVSSHQTTHRCRHSFYSSYWTGFKQCRKSVTHEFCVLTQHGFCQSRPYFRCFSVSSPYRIDVYIREQQSGYCFTDRSPIPLIQGSSIISCFDLITAQVPQKIIVVQNTMHS